MSSGLETAHVAPMLFKAVLCDERNACIYPLVFIFGWIQKRTKKITAVKTRADIGSCSAKINQTRSLRSLKQD